MYTLGAEHQCSFYITVNPFISLVGWFFVWSVGSLFTCLFVCLLVLGDRDGRVLLPNESKVGCIKLVLFNTNSQA